MAAPESLALVTTKMPLIGRPFNISMEAISETRLTVVYNILDREFLVVWENK
jgi:hypothetical protein